MDSQSFRRLFFMLIWIFVSLLHSVYPQLDTPTLSLDSRVYVIITGEALTINCHLKKPANQSRDNLTCSDPLSKQIYNHSIDPTPANQPKTHDLKLELKNLKMTGEYSCKYQNTKVYWFLRVRDTIFYRNHIAQDYMDVIIGTVFTGVLLVLSVVGSVYVFRGHLISKCGETGKQNKDEGKRTETEDGNVYVKTAPSTSVYASLEPRTRSIYDELDHSAASKKPDQQRPKPRKTEPNQTKLQSTQHKDEGQLDSVYENY